jgi:pyochelin biosynthesis protein PchC
MSGMSGMSGSAADPFGTWLRSYLARPAAGMRLVCFPHAGGSARFFRSWAAALPPVVALLAVQYPGREDRIRESCVTRLDELAAQVTDALGTVRDRPLVLFGHSLGAAVAYEVARRLDATGPGPAALVVSGRPAPGREHPASLHRQGEEALWQDVRRLAGTSSLVLDDPRLRGVLLPALRGDYQLSETYRPAPGPPLRCPVIACLGDRDPEVSVAEARDWGEVTTGGFSLQVFAGDHFYLVPRAAEVIAAVVSQLAAHEVRPAWPSAP